VVLVGPTFWYWLGRPAWQRWRDS